MRVIAGEFRGRPLKAPKGEGTRPTTDRVRESMMSAVASARGGFDDAVVLDAFAGSGALGIEALSRGAQRAHLYECDGEALRTLLSNVKALGLEPRRATLHRADVLKSPPTQVRQPFDLVFLDPPYAYSAQDVLDMVGHLCSTESLVDGAIVVYEHAATANDDVDDAAKAHDLSLARRKKYGDTVVDVLRAPRAGNTDSASEREQDHS